MEREGNGGEQSRSKRRGGLTAWLRLAVGIALLVAAVQFLMRGYTPPGIAGAVWRHNLRCGVDATPLFYTEVESLMPEEPAARD
ncbi:MAG TPA: hypothetical protein EYP14_11315 [Planctomycetaceae bacterium]|nr:hypothetical protein [Planctomycetaceae bacterium]